MSNKTQKYLLYAIGEITLVMIGILLALQVNNWNLNRLDKQKEQRILQDLKVEFEVNLSDLKRTIEQHEINYSELKSIQQITLSKQYQSPMLDSLMFVIPKWFTFTDRPGASDNLVNSGNLNLISNKELRDLITQWSGTVNDVVDDELYTNDFIRETMLPFLAAHYPVSNIERANNRFVSMQGLALTIDTEPALPIQEVNWEQLLTNQEFQSLIAIRKIYEMHCILEGNKARNTNEEIIRLINQEIQ